MAQPEYIKIQDYDYELPDERIARHPLEARAMCKLLVYSEDATVEDRIFKDLPLILPFGAVLVYNNTKVINARLKFRKLSGASIEIFCLEPEIPSDYERNFAARGKCSWNCLIGNLKRWKDGTLSRELPTPSGKIIVLEAERLGERKDDGSYVVEFRWNSDLSFSEIISLAGEIPIPPYLNRSSEETDNDDYQTVYSRIEGSVAAPTAGLHFTDELLDELDKVGICRREVTLHVGAGTFRPVKSEIIGDHEMHSEFITVTREFLLGLEKFLDEKRPIIAVGTTSVRTLESLYHIGYAMIKSEWTGELSQWAPYISEENEIGASRTIREILNYMDGEGLEVFSAHTRIIIAPGYKYKIVDAMITNFHQPKSTLLLLVSAFIGDGWKKIYNHALNNDYRFLSYGDACLLFKNQHLCL